VFRSLETLSINDAHRDTNIMLLNLFAPLSSLSCLDLRLVTCLYVRTTVQMPAYPIMTAFFTPLHSLHSEKGLVVYCVVCVSKSNQNVGAYVNVYIKGVYKYRIIGSLSLTKCKKIFIFRIYIYKKFPCFTLK
jgi:hypothetical protein